MKNTAIKISRELVVKDKYSLDKIRDVISMANVLKHHIVKQVLYTTIKGKNYAHVDAWQFAGMLTGLNVVIESTENLSTNTEIKWKSVAVLYHNEIRIGRGDALCSSKEANKKAFDEYAVLSMSQTRAIGKAYRNKIGWIMKMAGMEATPSEEMRKVNEEPKQPQEVERIIQREEKRDLVCHGATKGGCPDGADLTQQEYDFSMQMYGKPLCRGCQAKIKGKK